MIDQAEHCFTYINSFYSPNYFQLQRQILPYFVHEEWVEVEEEMGWGIKGDGKK